MWLYKNKVINKLEDLPEGTFGFIYKITNKTDGKFYIGKKQIMSQTNVKLGKKELEALPTQRGKKPSKKLVIKESNWVDYMGSNKFLLEDIKNLGEKKFIKEIIIICPNKKLLTYWELTIQCKYDVLQVNSYNDNLLGKFYRRDFLS
jgi:hypothetical protein